MREVKVTKKLRIIRKRKMITKGLPQAAGREQK